MPASLIPTSPNSQLYKDAENRFWSDWKGPYTKPSVVNVFYINHQRQQVWNNYDAYSKKVGNEKYMYHGATRACNLGDDNYQVIACQLVNCDVCSILRASIDPLILDPLSKFGLGAYVAPNSSKSANPTRYLKNANPTQSPNLVLLRCAVALGNTYYTKKAMLVTKPPDGYDSITAVTKLNGGIVKYSESVVFKRDAVLPVEVIVLRFPGSPGIPANPYSNFTKRLKNISGGDWNKYPESIRDTYKGETLWTDGDASFTFPSAPGIQLAYKVVRRNPPDSPTGTVVGEGYATSSPFYFALLD